MSPFFVIFCLCGFRATASSDTTLWRNTQNLRRANCTKCEENLQLHVKEVLPRLTLIKQRILNAIGRNPDSSMTNTSNPGEKDPYVQEIGSPEVLETVSTQKPAKYRIQEIISYSQRGRNDVESDVLTFSLSSRYRNQTEEAIGASLLIFVDRRRKMRNGGKGKRVIIDISVLEQNTTWQILSILRTRVKRGRWKRIRLPVKAAQQILDSVPRTLNIRIRCLGCGRLVQVVLDKYSPFRNKKDFNPKKDFYPKKDFNPKNNNEQETQKVLKYNDNNKRCKRHRRLKRRHKNSGSPILVINTRVPV